MTYNVECQRKLLRYHSMKSKYIAGIPLFLPETSGYLEVDKIENN